MAVAAVDILEQWPAVAAVALRAEWVAAPEREDRGSQRAVIVADL